MSKPALESKEFSSLGTELACFKELFQNLKKRAIHKLVPVEDINKALEGLSSLEFHLNTVLEKALEDKEDARIEIVKLQREVEEYEKETEANRLKDDCVEELLKALAEFDFRGGDSIHGVVDAYRVYKVNVLLP
jgi:hypothetical protein